MIQKYFFVKENDSISQKLVMNGVTSNASLTLKDSIGGTQLNWTVIGSADFKTKIKAAFKGGVESFTAKMFQNSLNNVNAIITKEIKTFSADVIGTTTIEELFYVKQTATVKLRDMNSKITPMLQKMNMFFKNGNLQMNGKPFVIYESTDTANGTITFSVCGPLKEEIFVSDPSDVSIEKLEPFTALKTVLKGDYSHRDEAVKKAMEYISENKINRNTALKYMDIYVVSANDEKSPSKWVTEVLIPINVVEAVPVLQQPIYVKPAGLISDENATPSE